jgi:hypothetical protein
MNSESRRLVKVLKNGEWIETQFEKIKKGDIIRLYEPSGELVRGFGGETEFEAICDAYMDIEHGVYAFAYKEVG